ncbi:hypothetical protein CDAR_45931 [Caerostris darwini]|uniref:Uncharacterized protein n=1 Tax=Caerostris darwini TaxID=1538125 RepID=A0AAV4M696_9ARAC|nr:hypothetical protein CDAR_45931 [Caerostris darwini]
MSQEFFITFFYHKTIHLCLNKSNSSFAYNHTTAARALFNVMPLHSIPAAHGIDLSGCAILQTRRTRKVAILSGIVFCFNSLLSFPLPLQRRNCPVRFNLTLSHGMGFLGD